MSRDGWRFFLVVVLLAMAWSIDEGRCSMSVGYDEHTASCAGPGRANAADGGTRP